MAAVIILGEGVTALGTLRAFGRAGVPLQVVAPADDWLTASRWYRPAARPDGSRDTLRPADLERYLRALGDDRAVLVPCSDHWVRAVASLPPDLAAHFPSSIPPLATLSIFVDKGTFAEFLQREAIDHPTTRILASETHLAELPERAFSNLFLKPRDSQGFYARYGVKAFRVHSRNEALARFRQVSSEGHSVILQRYVPGPPDNHYFVDGFVDRGGRVRALFARRRLRIYPPDFGNSTYMATVPVDEVAPAVTNLRRLLAASAYRGIFSAEFKRDADDGAFRILEVNTRPWWYIDFAESCGVHVCNMAYRDALGLDVEEARSYPIGATCIYPYFDFASFRASRDHSAATWAEWVSQLAHSRQPIFAWDDPLPWGKAIAALMNGRIARARKKDRR
jgi:predicted ATP-grasp superfamily ATP-dependent carboligase